jgi:hypothetical protein
MISISRKSTILAVSLFATMLLFASIASACPNCKDSLEGDPTHQGLAKGFYFSILFMISMPFVTFGSLCTYFFYLVQREKKRMALAAVSGGSNAKRPTRTPGNQPGFSRSPSPSG